MDIYDFWMSVLNYPYKCAYPRWYLRNDIHPCKDILQLISVEHKYPCLGIHIFYECQSSIIHSFRDIHAWTSYGFSIQGPFVGMRTWIEASMNKKRLCEYGIDLSPDFVLRYIRRNLPKQHSSPDKVVKGYENLSFGDNIDTIRHG